MTRRSPVPDDDFWVAVPERLIEACGPEAPQQALRVWCRLERLRQRYGKHRGGMAYRSVADLAADLRIGRWAVKRALAWLEANGWITRHYRVSLPTGFRPVDGGEQPSAPSDFEVHMTPVRSVTAEGGVGWPSTHPPGRSPTHGGGLAANPRKKKEEGEGHLRTGGITPPAVEAGEPDERWAPPDEEAGEVFGDG